jgi:hypothetical protein
VETELIHSPLFTYNVNNGAARVRKKKKKKKRSGSLPGGEALSFAVLVTHSGVVFLYISECKYVLRSKVTTLDNQQVQIHVQDIQE